MKKAYLVMTIAAVVVPTLIIGGTWLYKRNASGIQKVPYATVDLSEVIGGQRSRFEKQLTKPDLSEPEKAAVIKELQMFGGRLEVELGKLGQECGCVIFAKQAVLGGNVPDLTAELSKRMAVK